jgi:calcineurin-like phosphoesterase family protein
MTNIYFTSDLHFGHKHIIEHNPERSVKGCFEPDDLKAHDEWLIDIWNSTIEKKDIVYVLGDFSFRSPEDTIKILQKLKGIKFLILGNHDKSSEHLIGYFKQITQIKDLLFKETNFDFLKENLQVSLCHFPMVSWNIKQHGSIQLHGHCHGNLDLYNKESPDLRVDVGIDSELANYKIVSLQQVYDYMKNKTNGMPLRDYAKQSIDGHCELFKKYMEIYGENK